MKKFAPNILFALCALSSHLVSAQAVKQGSIWFLELNQGIDFKTNPPSLIENSVQMYGVERTSAIADENGNLLFYTDGDTLWNSQHEVMFNGDDLTTVKGVSPITSVIVPHPGDGQLYYVFVANKGSDVGVFPEGLHYALVDLSLDNGKGSVIQKKVNLIEKAPSLLTVAGHADENSFWIISHDWGTNFYAYKVSQTGLSGPVISNASPVYEYESYQLKVSPDATRLAVTNSGKLDLYDFNAKTGEVSNYRTFGLMGARGAEFSPNSELLYVSTFQGTIVQYDVSTNDLNTIISSATEVGHRLFTEEFADMQLAFDGRIYIGLGPSQITDWLSCIEFPNLKGLACQYNPEGLMLPYANISHLPVSVQSFYRESPVIPPVNTCTSDPTRITIQSVGYADSLVWDFGDGSQEIVYAGLTGKNVLHTYQQPGDYTVKVKKYIDDIYRELTTTLSVRHPPVVDLGADTTLCEGSELFLDAGSNWTSQEWWNGETSQTIRVHEAGTYWVRVNNGYCERNDAIHIEVIAYPDISLGPDLIVCTNDPVRIEVPWSDDYVYQWSTGESTADIYVNDTGQYSVKVNNKHCQSADTVVITFAAIQLTIPDTIIVEYNENLELNAKGINIEAWLWDFGDGKSVTKYDANVIHHYTHSGIYLGTLTTSNDEGCSLDLPFTVVIPEHIFIPNIFTPNGDTFNDVFEILYNGENDIQLNVFNRWGQTVFSSDRYNNRWSGGDLPPGTYYYKILIGSKPFTGSLSLLR